MQRVCFGVHYLGLQAAEQLIKNNNYFCDLIVIRWKKKSVISPCLQAWHTCSSSFAVMFALKKPGGCQPLSPAATETANKRKRENRARGEVEEELCVPFFQKSDWLNVHVKKWAFTWVYNRDYITDTVASLYPRRLPSAPHWFTHS